MRLQLATFALVAALTAGNAIRGGAALAQSGETQVASDVLVYSDTDNVVVFSPQVGASHKLDDEGGQVAARYVLDAISAASADVVTSATYRFSEARHGVDLSLSKSVQDWLPSASYRYSHEPDYQSHGFTVGLARTLAGGDSTIGLTLGVVADRIGRVDTPSSAFSEELVIQTLEGSYTQTIDQKTLVRLVYSLAYQIGYMEKPYRSVPLFDDTGLAAAEANGGLDGANYDQFSLSTRPLEEVPDTRARHAVAARGLRYIPSIRSALKLDYRFYADSWGIQGHTVEPGLRFAATERWRFDLFGRLHWQSSASFWQRAYRAPGLDQIPALRSSDRSLSKALHLTGTARAERSGPSHTFYVEFGVMRSSFPQFLFLESRTAIISQLGYRWKI